MNKNISIQADADILAPTDDAIFKSLLTRNEPESQIVLMDIIRNVIGYNVVTVTVLNNEIPTTDIHQIQERLDVNCKLDNGDYVNIEMQATKMRGLQRTSIKTLINRVSYYACDIYSSQGIKGKDYDKLDKAYQITFADFSVFENRSQYINRFHLANDAGDVLTDDINIIFIELNKLDELLKKPIEEMTQLEMWLIFFKYADSIEKRGIVNRILEAKEEIGMAGDLLQSISKDEFERAKFLSRRKYINDLESEMNRVKEEGIEIGMEDFAREMIAAGEPIEKIAKYAKTSVERIERLKKEMLH